MPLLFKNCSFTELTYLWIRLNKTKLFLGNTKKTDRNNVKEQVKGTWRKITLERVSKV